MSVIFVVVPVAFVLAGLFLWGFLWSVKKGQYDDLDSPAVRAVFDDEDRVDVRAPQSEVDEARRD
ncbi:MAG: cbb3-type cytochrome oxidase assembly protein CcoS [Planctomycetota bacterium]